MDDQKSMQKAFWTSSSGGKWAVMAERIDAAHARVTAWLAGHAEPGDRVLDIGCGAGTTLRALQENGVTDLTGIDIAPRLLEVAARAAPGARLIEGDAQDYGFETASYDLILSQFGVMFFSESRAAFANLRRAARPGARLLFVCWRSREENPWFNVPHLAVEAELGPIPSDPDAPGPTRFRDIGQVTGMLSDAGWDRVEGERVTIPVTPPGTLDNAVEQVMAMGPAARALADEAVDDAMRDRVRKATRAGLARYETESGQVIVPAFFNKFTAHAS